MPRALPLRGVDAKDGSCTACGRRCREVPTEELRNWVVDVGGVVVCTECYARQIKEARALEQAGEAADELVDSVGAGRAGRGRRRARVE
jgi:hypothetical protein